MSPKEFDEMCTLLLLKEVVSPEIMVVMDQLFAEGVELTDPFVRRTVTSYELNFKLNFENYFLHYCLKLQSTSYNSKMKITNCEIWHKGWVITQITNSL